jgi:hypothetical protein
MPVNDPAVRRPSSPAFRTGSAHVVSGQRCPIRIVTVAPFPERGFERERSTPFAGDRGLNSPPGFLIFVCSRQVAILAFI